MVHQLVGIPFDKTLVGRTNLRKLATAKVTGLVAYFLGTASHVNGIKAGLATSNSWADAVRNYVIKLAYTRPAEEPGATSFNKVVYNGEIPLGSDRLPVCAPNAKRQESGGPACVSPASASAMSISLASIASVSSASVVSADARTSRIATVPLSGFTGYLGDPCTSDLDTNLNLPDTNDAVQQFCSGDWIWLAVNQPPTGVPANVVISGAKSSAKFTPPSSPVQEVGTELLAGPYDGPGACSVGAYPRSIASAECLAGFKAISHWCKYKWPL